MLYASSANGWFKIIFHTMHKQFVSKVYFHFQNMWKQVSKKGFAGLYNRQGPQGKIFKGDWNSLCLQSLSFCELRVCLDAPCLANDPSSKNERVSSTAGVWDRASWISVSPSFWPWRLGIYQVSKLIQASVQCYHYVGTIISRDHLAMNAMAGSGMCSTG